MISNELHVIFFFQAYKCRKQMKQKMAHANVRSKEVSSKIWNEVSDEENDDIEDITRDVEAEAGSGSGGSGSFSVETEARKTYRFCFDISYFT